MRFAYSQNLPKLLERALMFRVCAIFAFLLSTLAISVPIDTAEARIFAAKPKMAAVKAGPRPARWCGWWMRTQKGGGPEYNLARNWKNYGRSTRPRVGAVVVWSSHVGIITGKTEKGWVVKSGNDGGRVRERVRSVKGAVFRI